jgi:hypothetical protein
MDGVLTDFVLHALKTHGREEVCIGTWDIASCLGMSEDQFRRPINRLGKSWWRSIPELPWWKSAVRLAEKHDQDFFFLSSPSEFHHSWEGKRQWIRDRLGKDFKRIVLTEEKHHVASPGKVLVDDSEFHIEAWKKHGGIGILFPAPWNSLKDIVKSHEKISYLEGELESAAQKAKKEASRFQEAREISG